ncbi:MAG: hypothetical protein IT168_15570 [Bryobacterales bacterium]|nr:hypothetical protein [Bryobacterales bacterium]
MRWLFCLLFALPGFAQLQPQIVCDATAEPLQIRSEGLTELAGVVALNCTGAASQTVSGSLTLFVSRPVTNRLSGESVDVRMTLENPVGVEQQILGSALLINANTVTFPIFSFTMPANGQAILRISNVRVAVAPNLERSAVTAQLSTDGRTGIGIRNSLVTIAVPMRGLYANTTVARILCRGSNLPEEISFTDLIQAGTVASSLRVTEGMPASFTKRAPGTQNGVRVMLKYSGFPATARVFVPDVVVGSSGATPTSGGDFGMTVSGGVYGPTLQGSLLLARVPNPDVNGGGDTPVFNPAAVTQNTTFNSVSEVRLQNGQGWAVYEVMDSNAYSIETAQIPTFVSLPANTPEAIASAAVSFAPISTVGTASTSQPILRFLNVPPPVDCTVLRDCNQPYFPRLFVDGQQLSFTAPQGRAGFYQKYVRILNDNGGLMVWSATPQYTSGANWLKVSPEAGTNNATVIVSAVPEKLAKGVYTANLMIDAGPIAGTRVLPVTLTVTDPLPDPPVVTSAGPFVVGSFAIITGRRLVGEAVRVTLDGMEAQVMKRNVTTTEDTLTVLVPIELGRRTSAQLQITRDNVLSAMQTVQFAAAAPTILPAGIYNQNGDVNSQAVPELTGNYLVVYATGLPQPAFGKITARIHDREIEVPAYAGPVQGVPGVQQVNFQIPGDLPTMSTEVRVCGAGVDNPAERVCSKPVLAWIQRPPETDGQ